MVILDYRMPGTNGLEVAKEIIKINPKQRIIIASSYPRESLFYSMKELGQLVEFVQKPFNIDTLIDAIENKQFYSELQRLNQDAATQEFNLLKHEQYSDLPEIMLSSNIVQRKLKGMNRCYYRCDAKAVVQHYIIILLALHAVTAALVLIMSCYYRRNVLHVTTS